MQTLALSLILASGALLAGEKHDDFHSIVKRIEHHYGKKHSYGALMGVVGFASHFTRPAGASDFKIAIFEGLEPDERALPEFNPGPEWRPFIRTTSRHGERVVIFAREDGEHAVRTLMVTLDNEEAVVMQFRLDPRHFSKFVSDKTRAGDSDSER